MKIYKCPKCKSSKFEETSTRTAKVTVHWSEGKVEKECPKYGPQKKDLIVCCKNCGEKFYDYKDLLQELKGESIDKKLIDWIKRYYEKIPAEVTLTIKLQYIRGHWERWLLNIDGEKGKTRQIIQEEQSPQNIYGKKRVDIKVMSPEKKQDEIIWPCNEVVLFFSGEGGGGDGSIIYDRKTELFQFKEGDLQWIT